MKKITAVTIATSLGTSPLVGSAKAAEYAIDNTNKESNSGKGVKDVEALSSLSGTVSINALNVRSTPDTSEAPIGEVKSGEVLDIISHESNGWYKINFNGQIGYVLDTYVEVQNSVTPDYSIQDISRSGEVYGITGDINLNVRNMPSTDGDVLYKLKNGDKVTISGMTSNGWYRIVKDGKEAFTYGQYIKVNDIITLGKVVNVASNDVLNVRSDSSASAKLLYTLKNNSIVEILESLSNGWMKISYNGNVGYVNGKYISELPKGENVETIVPDSQLKGEKYEVISPINLRKTASWSGDIVKVVKKGEFVDVVEIDSNWAKVYVNNSYAYAPSMYLQKVEIEEPTSPKPETVTHKATMSINLRETATWSGNIIEIIKKGETLEVIEKNGEWASVYYMDKILYAPAKYLEIVESNTTPEKPSEPEKPSVPEVPQAPETTEYVVTSSVNMRATASWSGDVIKVIKTGEKVNVVEIEGQWAKIYDNGAYGYVPSTYISNNENIAPEEPSVPEVPQAPETTEYIVTGSVNMRATASWSGDVIKVIKTGEKVNVIEIDGQWAHIYDNGVYGYVPSSYITLENSPTPEQPEQSEQPEGPQDTETPETVETTPFITKDAVNMRESASWSGTVIKTIGAGTTVNVVSVEGLWAKIYDNGIYGYVPASYIEYTKFTDYQFTLSRYIELQRAKAPSYSASTFKSYLDPSTCTKYEILELNKFREISVSKLNTMLKQKNAGVLMNQGQAIYDTAKKLNIDPLYFITQSILETGYGKSTLAKGVTITEIADESKPITDSSGNITGYQMIPLDKPVTVYNLYGIGAKDNLPTMPNRALILGTTHAYKQGWTSVEKAIQGAGEFVSTNYINSTKYDQNTLYKFRYNPSETYLWHQYATTPWYARDIAKIMAQFDYIYEDGVVFTYDKPRFMDAKGSQVEEFAEISALSELEEEEIFDRIVAPDITEQRPWENQ